LVLGKSQLTPGALCLQGSLLKPKSNVMSKKFQLQIPEPCHEDWNKMTPVEKGRFCDSCQKSVVDFTGMSDMQLIAFFKKPSTDSVCGRFFNDQLEKDFEIPRKRIPLVKYLFQFAIPVFLASLKAQSQGNLVLKDRTTPTVFNCSKELMGQVGGVMLVVDQKKFSGRVVDEKGVGIPFASIFIKGTEEGSTCDSTGFFELTTRAHEKKIILIASSVGYASVEKQINRAKENFVEIILATNATLNGEVVVTATGNIRLGGARMSCVRIQRNYLERVKDFFTRDSIKVFPNPAKAGREIKILWKKADAGEYTIDLYNLQGQLIKSSLAEIENEANSFTFQIPVITSGSYVLRLTNKKSGKKDVEKIIIQ